MATSAWIESADTHGRASQSSGPKSTFSSFGDHLLVMAAQDRAAQEADRVAAARTVRRLAGDDAPELLDILGLTTPRTDADQPDQTEEAGPRKRCPGCRTHKPHSDYGRNPAKADGCNTYCRACMKERRKAAR